MERGERGLRGDGDPARQGEEGCGRREEKRGKKEEKRRKKEERAVVGGEAPGEPRGARSW